MEKNQIEGKYKELTFDMATIKSVRLTKIIPNSMTGKYKLGKYWNEKDKIRIATRIMKRAIDMPKQTLELLHIAGLNILDEKTTKELAWIHSTELVRMMGFENELKYPNISLVLQKDVDW